MRLVLRRQPDVDPLAAGGVGQVDARQRGDRDVRPMPLRHGDAEVLLRHGGGVELGHGLHRGLVQPLTDVEGLVRGVGELEPGTRRLILHDRPLSQELQRLAQRRRVIGLPVAAAGRVRDALQLCPCGLVGAETHHVHGQTHALVGEFGRDLARRRGRAGVDPVRDQHDRTLRRVRGQHVGGRAQRVTDRRVAPRLQPLDLPAQPVLVHRTHRRQLADIRATTLVVLRRIGLLRPVGEHPHPRGIRQRLHQLGARPLGHVQPCAAFIRLQHRRRGVHDDRQLRIGSTRGLTCRRRRCRRRTSTGVSLRPRGRSDLRQDGHHQRDHRRDDPPHLHTPAHTHRRLRFSPAGARGRRAGRRGT